MHQCASDACSGKDEGLSVSPVSPCGVITRSSKGWAISKERRKPLEKTVNRDQWRDLLPQPNPDTHAGRMISAGISLGIFAFVSCQIVGASSTPPWGTHLLCMLANEGGLLMQWNTVTNSAHSAVSLVQQAPVMNATAVCIKHELTLDLEKGEWCCLAFVAFYSSHDSIFRPSISTVA